MGLKILHTADIHLGAKFTYLGDKAAKQRNQLVSTLDKIVHTAIEQKADLFLIAGDLFDNPYPARFYVGHVISLLSSLIENEIYVAIIPGNHDRLEQGSVYFRPEFKKFNSDKLKVFMKDEVDRWYIAKLDTTVHGVAIVAQKSKQSPLQNFIKNTDSKYNIGLIHGSVDISNFADNYPIKQTDIAKLDFDYLALGDWHNVLNVSQGKMTAWYPGSPELIALDQERAGGVLLIDMDGSKVEVNRLQVGSRFIKKLQLDISKFNKSSEIVDSIKAYFDPQAVLILQLEGIRNLSLESDLQELNDYLQDKFFYISIQDNSTFNLSEEQLNAFPDELLVGKYIRILNDQRTSNPEQNKIIDQAIQLGIKLLSGDN